ncbi:MAG: hypothetical protein FJ271_18680 [Planctomycetes bacterium]|nr:hypothetical protein [Planctomycetota bacterium]
MKLCRWLGSLLVLAGLVSLVPNLPVFAQDKETTLKWTAFDPDTKPYYQTMYVKTDQKMTVMGMTVNQTQEQTFYATWTPGKKDKENWVVGMKIIGAKMDINIGGNKISYDSTADNPQQNPLTDFFNALLKLDLKFTINPKMTVEKIEGNEDLIKNLGKTNPQIEPLLKSILSADALKRMAEPPLYAFPPKQPVKKGDKWEKKDSELNLGPIGKYINDYTFEYAGKDDKKKELDKITVKATMKYVPPSDKGSKLPFIIESDSKLVGEQGTGTVLFNPAKGRFEDYSLSMTLKGDLNIDIGGMKTKVALTQEQTSKVTTSDTDPIAELKSKKK